MVAQCTTPVATMHHSTGDDAPSSAVKLHFLIGVRKGHALKTGHVERDVAGGRGEVAVVVTAAVALTSLATLIAGGLCQGLRLLLQQLVQGFLHAAADQFPDLTLSVKVRV